jgi:hypothetical protein
MALPLGYRREVLVQGGTLLNDPRLTLLTRMAGAN